MIATLLHSMLRLVHGTGLPQSEWQFFGLQIYQNCVPSLASLVLGSEEYIDEAFFQLLGTHVWQHKSEHLPAIVSPPGEVEDDCASKGPVGTRTQEQVH